MYIILKALYLITVKTLSSTNIGNVLISIYGSKDNIEKFQLKETKAERIPFAKKGSDTFELSNSDIGDVRFQCLNYYLHLFKITVSDCLYLIDKENLYWT